MSPLVGQATDPDEGNDLAAAELSRGPEPHWRRRIATHVTPGD